MEEQQGWLARRRRALIDGYADRSRTRAAGKSLDASAPGATTLAVWLLAGLVHLVTAVMLAFGGWCLWVGPWPVRVAGLLVLAFALVLAPRPHRPPAGGLGRDDVPELFGLLDRIASLNRAPVPARVFVDTDFNAGVTRVGGRRILVLGAPFWVAVPPPARISLLGHELGHLAHRDAFSSWWAGSARDALDQWGQFLEDLVEREDNLGYQSESGFIRLVLKPIVIPLRLGVMGYLWLMEAAGASSSRSREYLADLDAIAAGGSAAALALFDAMLTEHAVDAAVRRAAIRQDPDVWDEVRATLAREDLTQRLRRRALAQTEQSRIDDSHPLTALRIRLVEEREQVGPGVVVDTATWHRLDAELAPYLAEAGGLAARAVRYQR